MVVDISIVVPTCDRKERLRQCLDSLSNQNYPREKLEIIVVNDRANDDTLKMIEDFKKKYFYIRYIAQSRKGPAAARNLGAEASLGGIVAFIDDDCTVEENWAKSMIDTHRKNLNITAVGGGTFTATQDTPVLVGQFLSACSIETYINGIKEIIFFPTCNVSFKREIFEEYKFNEDFPLPGGEDLEFFWRLFKDGHRFIWNKEIKVIHFRDNNFYNFVRQAYFYGRGNFLTQYIHRDHPLLKELKVGRASFWVATVINIIKIPRFSYLLGRKLIERIDSKNTYKKLSVYLHFVVHKVFYIAGNFKEFFKIRTNNLNRYKNSYTIPRLLILDITHSCNISCRICDIWKTADIKKDINISYIKKILSQAKELKIREIALSGGEPLLRKDIFDIFEYARELKIKHLGVLTNGMLVEEHMGRLKQYMLDNTISLILSLDSLKSGMHNYIRNSNLAWQKTTENLNMLSLLKKEYPQINFNVIAIILNQNLEELLDLANFVKSLGANSLQFQTLLPNNLKMAERKKSLFWVSEERLSVLDGAIDRLIRFKRENQQYIRNSMNNLSLIKKYFRGELTSNDIKCMSAYKTILVSNQGECMTCFSCYGNIMNSTLSEILKSRDIIKAQKKVKECSWPCLLPCFCDL